MCLKIYKHIHCTYGSFYIVNEGFLRESIRVTFGIQMMRNSVDMDIPIMWIATRKKMIQRYYKMDGLRAARVQHARGMW